MTGSLYPLTKIFPFPSALSPWQPPWHSLFLWVKIFFYIPHQSEIILFLSFICLTYFTGHHALSVHPCCHNGRLSIFFLAESHANEDGKARECLCTAGGKAQPLWKIWRFLKKLKLELSHDLAIPLHDSTKPLPWKGICTPMFTIALFTTVKTGRQPMCQLMDEYIHKTW